MGESFKKENGKIYYHCTCVCGKKKEIYGSMLATGKSNSCGYMSHRTKENLVGQDFGLLHVEEKVMINNHTYWRCSCQCGGSKIVLYRDLKMAVSSLVDAEEPSRTACQKAWKNITKMELTFLESRGRN